MLFNAVELESHLYLHSRFLHKITEFEIKDTKTSSTAYLVMHELIT